MGSIGEEMRSLNISSTLRNRELGMPIDFHPFLKGKIRQNLVSRTFAESVYRKPRKEGEHLAFRPLQDGTVISVSKLQGKRFRILRFNFSTRKVIWIQEVRNFHRIVGIAEKNLIYSTLSKIFVEIYTVNLSHGKRKLLGDSSLIIPHTVMLLGTKVIALWNRVHEDYFGLYAWDLQAEHGQISPPISPQMTTVKKPHEGTLPLIRHHWRSLHRPICVATLRLADQWLFVQDLTSGATGACPLFKGVFDKEHCFTLIYSDPLYLFIGGCNLMSNPILYQIDKLTGKSTELLQEQSSKCYITALVSTRQKVFAGTSKGEVFVYDFSENRTERLPLPMRRSTWVISAHLDNGILLIVRRTRGLSQLSLWDASTLENLRSEDLFRLREVFSSIILVSTGEFFRTHGALVTFREGQLWFCTANMILRWDLLEERCEA